jgi:hypothetical protein
MPIQNVGTLLENLVVTEASLALLSFCHESAPLEFVNAFAMPPLAPWRPHAQNVGFDTATLDRVRSECGPLMADGEAYPALLRANLRLDADMGPNAALLVAAACVKAGVPCRMWLNDIRDGHYGDAVPELEKMAALAGALCGMERDAVNHLSVDVSDVDYPDSILELAKILRVWQPPGGSRIGFLDPMRYRIQGRQGPETSSEDHRRWLRQIAFDGPTCAVHFTGHSDHPSLERELRSLHDDAVAEGYEASRTFKRQHYAVFLAVRSSGAGGQAEELAAEIERRIFRAWTFWGRAFTRCRSWELKIYRNGVGA